jgi:hypothetical protein
MFILAAVSNLSNVLLNKDLNELMLGHFSFCFQFNRDTFIFYCYGMNFLCQRKLIEAITKVSL